MKTNLLQIVLFSILLVLLGQCTYDRPQNLIAPRSTSQQLASNADFAELVKITNHFQDVIYNNLRNAHSEKVRAARSRHIGLLLRFQDNKDSVVAAIRLLGFEDVNQYLLDLNHINLLKIALHKGGIEVGTLPSKTLAEAYAAVSQQLGHAYPPKPSTARNGEISTASGSGGYCPECHFNNCDECNANDGPGDPTIDNPNTGGSGGVGYSCRAEAEIRRENASNIVTAAFIAALSGCGWTGLEVGTYTTGILIETGPFAPAAGAGATVVTIAACAGLATWTYSSAINIIESTYRTDMAGCRN